MKQLFPKWVNLLPPILGIVVTVGAIKSVFFVWYFFSPKYTDAGYRPVQPVPFSHKLHAGDLGMDCRYCHNSVEVASHAAVPPTATCMNCHQFIKPESDKLAPIRDSFENQTPMQWIRVHKLPDYAYFNHSAHLRAGVGCESCHGNIAQMEVVMQKKPLSMSWCLDCHRAPEKHLRPLDAVTQMGWEAPENQMKLAKQYMNQRNIKPPVDCSGCHR